MRILFLNSIGKKKWGGGEKWMLMAASGLADKGHEVFIGCAPRSDIFKNAESMGLPVANVYLGSDFDVPGFFSMIRVLKRHRITHVVCGQNKDSKVAAVAARCVGGISVLARHGLTLISKKLKYKIIFSRWLDGIITNSHSIKSEYDSYGWFARDFVRVIYNGFTPPENITPIDFKSRYHLEADSLVLFSAGRLARQKGYDVLIEAAVISRRRHKKWYFFIAGKGKLEKKLKQKVVEKQLEQQVIFLDFINDVLPYVKGADLFVLPSFYEGMPNAVMEAMGMGKCCVTTAVNGNSELIENGIDGVLVEPHSAKAFYEGLAGVLDSRILRKKMGERARAKVAKSFSEARMVNELEEFLLLKAKKPEVK